MNKKGYLEISFGWLFAIIVGVAILFLAIYFSVKLTGIGEKTLDAKTGKEIGILLNPLETGFESARTTYITFPVNTRIYNKCSKNGYFGKQIIQISQRSFNKWTETEVSVSFENKYLFSNGIVEGRKDYLFSKPFNFPFKVADLIYITSSTENYCFRDSPEEIQQEISNLNQANLKAENCTPSQINVCFQRGPNCDIVIDYNTKTVSKNNTQISFEGDALMYAAIFSEVEIYECQLQRLMRRIVSLASIYGSKGSFVSREGCNSNLEYDLLILSNMASNLGSSRDLKLLSLGVEEIQDKNEANSGCKLW